MRAGAIVIIATGCGRLGFALALDAGPGSGSGSGSLTLPCPAPPVVDTSAPDHIVGDGTPASCTDAALRDAVALGGVIALDCGAAPITIPLAGEIPVTLATTVIVGTGVTLDAGNASRAFHAMTSVQQLTLIGLTIVNGSTTASGAGVFLEAGAFLVIDGAFSHNVGPVLDPSNGGGAISAQPGATIAIYRSTFDSNASANGGAIQVFNDLTVIDSTFTNNSATGTGGSMASGGLGGGIEAVGLANNTMCGDTIASNSAGQNGGGYARISIDGTGSDSWDQSSVLGNSSATGGGGMYVQDIAISLRRVVVANNTASYTGGLWYIGSVGPFVANTIEVSENTGTSGLGAGLSIGTVPGSIAFSTVSTNHASCTTCWGAAIDGGGQTLTASVIADNTVEAANVPVSCVMALADGGDNFQWPVQRVGSGTDDPGALCTPTAHVIDPVLGTLAMRTGPGGSYLVATPPAGSPVIGGATNCPAVDILGNPRPEPCSAGVVEPETRAR